MIASNNIIIAMKTQDIAKNTSALIVPISNKHKWTRYCKKIRHNTENTNSTIASTILHMRAIASKGCNMRYTIFNMISK